MKGKYYPSDGAHAFFIIHPKFRIDFLYFVYQLKKHLIKLCAFRNDGEILFRIGHYFYRAYNSFVTRPLKNGGPWFH